MSVADPRLLVRLEAHTERYHKKFAEAANDTDRKMKRIDDRLKKSGSNVHRIFDQMGSAVGGAFGNITGAGGAQAALDGLSNSATGLSGSLRLLGPAGVAAGAAMVTLGVGISQALAAANYADEIADTAKTLGVTTDQLQELSYMAIKSGGDIDTFRKAVESGNAALGKFQSQIGAAKVSKAFEAIGISREQAATWNTVVDGLDEIAGGISNLQSEAQKASIAKALGLEGMLPALKDGSAAILQMQADAKALGFVMDTEMIAKAGEMKDKIELASMAIDLQMKQAFIDLLPVIADVVSALAGVMTQISLIIAGFKDIEQRSDAQLMADNRQREKFMTQDAAAIRKVDPTARVENGRMVSDKSGFMHPEANALRRFNENRDKMERNYYELHKRKNERGTPPSVNAPALAPPKSGGGSKSKTKVEDVAANAARLMEQQAREHIRAQMSLTEDVYEQSELRKQLLALDYASQTAAIAKQEAEKKILPEVAQQAQLQASATYLLEQQAEDLKLQRGIDAEELDARTAANEAFIRLRDAQAQMAKTALDRAAFEADSFKARQAIEREKYEADQDWLVTMKRITAAEKAKRMATFDQTQGAEMGAFRDRQDLAANPLKAMVRDHGLKDMNTELQNVAVQGFGALNDGITNAIMGTEKLGDVFRNVANQIIADLIRIAVQKMIVGTIANLILPGSGTFAASLTGHASGTRFAPGGLALVGEKGPELVNMPRGAEVFSNNLLMQMGAMPSGAARSGPTYQTFHTEVHANDAVTTGAIKSWIVQANAQTLQMAKQQTNGQIANFATKRLY